MLNIDLTMIQNITMLIINNIMIMSQRFYIGVNVGKILYRRDLCTSLHVGSQETNKQK